MSSDDPDLFAEVLEYREALAALKEFGSGYNVVVERRWAIAGVAQFVVTITKRAPMEPVAHSGTTASWHAHGTDGNLLTAVRAAIQHARMRQKTSEGSIIPGTIATGQQGPMTITGAMRAIREGDQLAEQEAQDKARRAEAGS